MYSCPLKYQASGTRHSLYSLYLALVTNTSFLDQPQSVRSGLSFLVMYSVTSWSIVSCAKSIVTVVPESFVVGSFSHVKRATMPSFVRSSTNLLRMPLQTDDTFKLAPVFQSASYVLQLHFLGNLISTIFNKLEFIREQKFESFDDFVSIFFTQKLSVS